MHNSTSVREPSAFKIAESQASFDELKDDQIPYKVRETIVPVYKARRELLKTNRQFNINSLLSDLKYRAKLTQQKQTEEQSQKNDEIRKMYIKIRRTRPNQPLDAGKAILFGQY